MEDNKDFDKDKQETGTQQMPHRPAEGEEDEKKAPSCSSAMSSTRRRP